MRRQVGVRVRRACLLVGTGTRRPRASLGRGGCGGGGRAILLMPAEGEYVQGGCRVDARQPPDGPGALGCVCLFMRLGHSRQAGG